MSDTNLKKEIVTSQPQVWPLLLVLLDSEYSFSFAFLSSKNIAQMKVGGNKNALNREIGEDGKRDWSFGLFDCRNACGLCM